VNNIKISLVTVTYNAAATIDKCISSVIAQSYNNIEYIIIDGQSTDNTSALINNYKKNIHLYVSEPDKGIYDAMNKGIAAATGDVIGILNADDWLADNQVVANVAHAFEVSGADIVYGDIDYVNNRNKIVRRWRSGQYKQGMFNSGWMPPHTAFYAKAQLFTQAGIYNLQYGSATDYELMLRFIHYYKFSVYYLNKVLVKMLVGGVSNKNIVNRIKAWQNDYTAMGSNGVKFPQISIFLKPLRKIIQYIS